MFLTRSPANQGKEEEANNYFWGILNGLESLIVLCDNVVLEARNFDLQLSR